MLPGPGNRTFFRLCDAFHAVIVFCFKRADLFFAACNDCKGRRLYTSAGKLCIILAGQCAGRVDSYQPVRFCTASGSFVQIIVLPSVPQMRESFPDCLVGDRRDPESFDRFVTAGLLQDPTCNQFAVTAGIGSDDDFRDVFSE